MKIPLAEVSAALLQNGHPEPAKDLIGSRSHSTAGQILRSLRLPRDTTPTTAKGSLLQIHRHNHVQEIRPALKQPMTVWRSQLQRNIIAIDNAQRLDQKRRLEADLHVRPLVLAREIHRRLAALRGSARQ